MSHPTPFYYNAINKILTAGTQRMPETFNEWQDLKCAQSSSSLEMNQLRGTVETHNKLKNGVVQESNTV